MKGVLFTNLSYVWVRDVRAYCSALLLVEDRDFLDPRTKRFEVRGFGPCPEWPVFDMRVKSIDFSITKHVKSNNVVVGDSGQARPLFSGSVVELKEGPALVLISEKQEEPIDVERFSGRDLYPEIWDVLRVKARRYWGKPAMPELVYRSNFFSPFK